MVNDGGGRKGEGRKRRKGRKKETSEDQACMRVCMGQKGNLSSHP